MKIKRQISILCLILFGLILHAQPSILYTNLGATTPASTNSRYLLNDFGIFRQFRFQANVSAAASSALWAFHIGSAGSPDYSNNWRPNVAGQTISLNNHIPTSFTNGARYNTAGGGFDGLLPAITNGNYYTFNVVETGGNDKPMQILETTYAPVPLVSQTYTPSLTANNGGVVTVTSAAVLNANEYVYLRYTTDGFLTSNFIQVPFTGTTGTLNLPCFGAGTNVEYYFYTSSKTFTQITADVVAYGQASAHDMNTLNILNNGGPNYTYTQSSNTNFEGTYYVPSICYPTLASFITAINAGTVVNNVIVNVAAGYTETSPTSGYRLIANGGLATRSITFQKNGVGANPTFTASASLVAGNNEDALFKILGSDFITIDGFTFLENPGNTNKVNTTNNMIEFGIALGYLTSTNGAQNITIKNCTIDLDRTYTNSYGIYSNNSHNETASSVLNGSTTFAGSNSNLKIASNIINDVNIGIAITGSPVPADHNDGLIIGGSAIEGNTISNFGYDIPTTFFQKVPQNINGIVLTNVKNITVSYNTISNAGDHVSTSEIKCIFHNGPSMAAETPIGTFVNNFTNNTLSLKSNLLANDLTGIKTQPNSGNTSSTINISNNRFTNFTYLPTTAVGSGTFEFIGNSQSYFNLNIEGNEFDGIIANTTPSLFFIRNSVSLVSGATKNINNNNVNNFSKTGGSAGPSVVYFYQDMGASLSGSFVNNLNNSFTNVNCVTGNNITAWNNQDGLSAASSPLKKVSGNTFNNVSGLNQINLINLNGLGDLSEVSNNTITNISGAGSQVNGIILGTKSSGSILVDSNTIDVVNAANNTTTGIELNSEATLVVSANKIKRISSNGKIFGISSVNALGTVTIQNNEIDDLRTSNTGVQFISGIENTLAAKITIKNNSIKNLLSTSITNTGGLRGINCTLASTTAGFVPEISGNVVDSFTANSTDTTNLNYGINVAGAGLYNISNNTISNFNVNTRNPVEFVGINNASIGLTQKVNGNTIFNLKANNATAVNVANIGINVSGLNAGSEVYRNKIYNLENKSTGTSPKIYGIYVPNSGTWSVANNMISLKNGTNTNGVECIGIIDDGLAGARNYYYNSVNIEGNSTSALKTAGFQYNKNAGTVNIKNNIFQNVRTGSGKNYAVANTGADFTGLNFSHNILYSTNPNTIGQVTGPADRDYPGFITSSASTNSYSSLTTFADTSVADLHINATTCSDSEGFGTPIVGFLNDFDNDTRSTTAPDIGADEATKASHIWTGVWTPGTPNSSSSVEIRADYNMTTQPNIEACSIRVSSGATLTIAGNKYINIQNNITVDAGSFLNVSDKGSIVQVNDNAQNLGNINYERIAKITFYDYVYWSSPVYSTTKTASFPVTSLFGGNAPVNKIFKWETTAINANGTVGNYINTSENMIQGKGYIARAPLATSSTVLTDVSTTFTGVPINGFVSVPLFRGANGTTLNDNFNLIGNPYPSAIDATDFLNTYANPLSPDYADIQGNVKIWTHSTGLLLTNPNPFYQNFTYNYSASNFATYNGMGSTLPAFLGKIAAGQSFFVTRNDAATANSTNLVFKNNLRNITHANDNFFRQANTINYNEVNRIWLDLISPSNEVNRILLGNATLATNEIDMLYDAETENVGKFNFYSIIGPKIFNIEGKALPFDINTKYDLGANFTQNGNHKIAIAQTDGMFSGDNAPTVYLEDKLLQTTHNLSLSPYEFNQNIGTINNRFVLKFNDIVLNNPSFETLQNETSIFSNNQKITVNSIKQIIKSIEVYDFLGRLVYAKSKIGTNGFIIDDLKASNQALIVKVQLDNDEVVNKKIIF
jgi:hypothetical protein